MEKMKNLILVLFYVALIIWNVRAADDIIVEQHARNARMELDIDTAIEVGEIEIDDLEEGAALIADRQRMNDEEDLELAEQ